MKRILIVAILLQAALAQAKLEVVTSLPDLAWAAREIGGDLVSVKALLKGTEDPHYADAVPEFIRLAASAQVVCVVGLELEVGWMPKVLSRSGNAAIQPGGKGYCETGKSVTTIEKPDGPVNRSMGDVHPAGNPHFWLSPTALGQGSKEILDAFIRVDAANAETYKKNHAALIRKLDAAVAKGKAKIEPLLKKSTGPTVLEYHKEFGYLLDLYSIKSFGSIEEKPGVPPSAGRIAEIGSRAKAGGVKLILATDYNPRKTVERVGEISGVKAVIAPSSVQPEGAIKDYIQLHEHIVDSIAGAIGKGS